MSKQFQVRFKGRSSLMPSSGITKLALRSSVNSSAKPNDSDYSKESSYTSPKLQTLTPGLSYISYSQSHPEKVLIKPEKKALIINKSASPAQKKANFLDYTEDKLNYSYTPSGFNLHTLKDYHMTKPKIYFQFGGLGPVHVGNEDWEVKKKIYEKRLEYGQKNYNKNSVCSPINDGKKLKELASSRKRSIEFAKTIIRPALKVPTYLYR